MASLNSWALTTLADVKESLGIDAGNTTNDNLIIRKINQATDMIESYCGKNNSQHFASTVYTNEEYDGTGTDQLILKNRPVITFTSLQQRDSTLNDNDFTTVTADLYFTDMNAGVIDGRFEFLQYYNLYRATYTAGFATIPSDLAEACATLACYLYDNSTSGTGVKKKSQGPKNIEYFEPMQGESLMTQLGLDDTLQRYTDIPILADK